MVQAAYKNDISKMEMSKIASYNFRSIYRNRISNLYKKYISKMEMSKGAN